MLYLMKKYPFKYHISTRFEMCNEWILEKLSVIDLWSVQIWLQSISKSANKTSKRWFLAEKFEKVIMELKNNGTSVSIDTILWLPDDSPSGFLSTIKYAISLKPSSIVTNTLYLNPRTEIYRNKEEYRIETHEARWTLHYYKARRIKSSMNFKANEIELCRKFLIECKKKIPSIQFVIR
jgi:coproporphyrinogen III oxidase-like Fe-S oxidoreductase